MMKPLPWCPGIIPGTEEDSETSREPGKWGERSPEECSLSLRNYMKTYCLQQNEKRTF